MILNWGFDFASQVTSGNVWKHFWLSTCKWGRMLFIWWAEARDAAKFPVMHRAASPPPHNEELSAPNVNSAETEKPWYYVSVHEECCYSQLSPPYLLQFGQLHQPLSPNLPSFQCQNSVLKTPAGHTTTPS